MHSSILKLMLLTHPNYHLFPDYYNLIRNSIQGGVTSIQLRNKLDPPETLKRIATDLLTLLRPLHVPLIINDNVDLALEIDADGVHLGQSDLSPHFARTQLGANKIIGWSVETDAQLQIADQLDCIDYIAASAVFPSKNKQNCQTIWGLAGLQKIVAQSKHPVIAIGGINPSNVLDVMQSGANGVAVISAIHNHDQPEIAARELIQSINQRDHHA